MTIPTLVAGSGTGPRHAAGVCWGLTSGNAGMIAQVRALAGAMGVEPVMKKVDIKPVAAWLPNVIAAPLRSLVIPHFIDPKSDALEAPYPDLVISCGRRTAMVAMGLRYVAPKTKFIHIQDPLVNPKFFDCVVAMEHDSITGTNVIKTRYALHSITPEVLRAAAEQFAPRFASYPKPHVAVLLGGSTNKYRLSKGAFAQVVLALQKLLQDTNGSLLITPSRRTGEDNIAMLRNHFAGNPRVYIYIPPPIGGRLGGGHSCATEQVSPHPGPPPNGEGESNPYMGLLALADFIVVTNDSVNMMSEARATGKPIYILELPGHTNTKPTRFAQMVIAEGAARPLGRTLESWNYPVSDEMRILANNIKYYITPQ